MAGLGCPVGSLPQDSAAGVSGERHGDGRQWRRSRCGCLEPEPLAWPAAAGRGGMGATAAWSGPGPAGLPADRPGPRPPRSAHRLRAGDASGGGGDPGPLASGLLVRSPAWRSLGPGMSRHRPGSGGGAGEAECPADAHPGRALGRSDRDPARSCMVASGPAAAPDDGPADRPLVASQLDHQPGGNQPCRFRIRSQGG